jgi:hypothetical protein
MNRAFVSLVVVCAFAAAAPAAITHSITLLGTYTLGIGTTPTIDVYKVGFACDDPNRVIGALVLGVGSVAGDPCYAQGIPVDPNDPNDYDDAFNAAWRVGGKTPVTMLTPTRDDANTWLTPPDTSKCYETDSSFLPPNIGSSVYWPTSTLSPTETNDASIYYTGNDDYVAGVGWLAVAKAVPVALRTNAMDAIMVGVIQGDTVYVYTGSADDLGMTTKERFLVPEPATLTLLGLGALCLIRRRR